MLHCIFYCKHTFKNLCLCKSQVIGGKCLRLRPQQTWKDVVWDVWPHCKTNSFFKLFHTGRWCKKAVIEPVMTRRIIKKWGLQLYTFQLWPFPPKRLCKPCCGKFRWNQKVTNGAKREVSIKTAWEVLSDILQTKLTYSWGMPAVCLVKMHCSPSGCPFAPMQFNGNTHNLYFILQDFCSNYSAAGYKAFMWRQP